MNPTSNTVCDVANMAYASLLSRALDNHDSGKSEVLRKTIPFIILATLSVIGRYWSRSFRKASFGADDYIILPALIFTWGVFAVGIVDTYLGIGNHTALEPSIDVSRHYKTIFASSIIYASSITAIKISILLFYQRVFPTRRFKLATRTLGGLVVAWWITVVTIQIFSCHPVNGYWDISIPSQCLKGAEFYISVAVANILIDIVMLCLPLRMVWRLQTSTMQKLALSMTFLTGAFVIVASLYRVVLLHQTNRTDPLWTYTGAVIWTSIEPSVGVISSCLPTMRPLLQGIWCKGQFLLTKAQSVTSRQDKIQLGSDGQKRPKTSASYHTKWIDKGLDFYSSNDIPGQQAVTTSVRGPDSNREDIHLMGINVQRDVDVEHGPL